MKIAIYHGFPHIHFEMLGYVIEYFKSNNMILDVDIYSYVNIFSYEWWSFYNKIFNIKLTWYDPRIFNSDAYEYVFLITDDDISFLKKPESNIKIISIEHIDYPRRRNIHTRIGTRFFINRPATLWALPCFKAITQNEKNNILNNENKINVVSIGKNQPNNIEQLKNLFNNYYEINFHFIIRKLDSDNELLNCLDDNIFVYINCLTSVMLELLSKSHYVLCFDINNNDHYAKKAISGSIPLSFTFGCKLILPELWNLFYNFKSCICYSTYENNKLKLYENNKLTLYEDTNLDLIYDEQYELIHHRNIIFDKAISYENIKINNYNYIINKLGLIIPNICIVDINLEDIENDYREFHLFNENIIKKIKEPLLFIINNSTSEYLDLYFKYLSDRVYIDIIIINYGNNHTNLYNIIKTNYSKHHIFYICNETNKLIIIPQR